MSLGDGLDATQSDITPAIPTMKAAVTAVEQTDFAKDVKQEIDKFSEGIPALFRALNEVKKLHPFIAGELSRWHTRCEVTGKLVVVLAFETVYTLEQKRRDNDKKVIALYIEMKDMMRVLLLSVIPRSTAAYSHLTA